MKKIFYIFLFLLMIDRNVYSQNDFKGDRIILNYQNTDDKSTFYVYNPPLVIKGIYNDTLEAINKYPEQLLISVLSSTNQIWDNYNYIDHKAPLSENHRNAIKKSSISKNYYKLHCKYTFILNGLPTSIIKFYAIVEGSKRPLSGINTLQLVLGKWVVSPINGFDNIKFLIMRFNEDKLDKVLKGGKTGDVIIDKIIEDTRSSDGGTDWNKLLRIYGSWYERKDIKLIEYFIDKSAW